MAPKVPKPSYAFLGCCDEEDKPKDDEDTDAKLDYYGLVKRQAGSVLLPILAIAFGFMSTFIMVNGLLLNNSDAWNHSYSLTNVVMQVLGYSMYILILNPPWKRSEMVSEDEDEDAVNAHMREIAIWSTLCIVSASGMLLQLFHVWLIAPCFGIALIILPFGRYVGNLSAHYQEFQEAWETIKKARLEKTADFTDNILLALQFLICPKHHKFQDIIEDAGTERTEIGWGSKISLAFQVLILLVGTIFWLIASLWHFKTGEGFLMEWSVGITLILVLVALAWHGLGLQLFRHGQKGFHGSNGASSYDQMWGIRTFFCPFDCGGKLVVMVYKQMLVLAFFFWCFSAYWTSITMLKQAYTFHCVGEKGMALFVSNPADPMTQGGVSWMPVVDKLCTKEGANIVHTPLMFEGKLSHEVGVLFEFVFMFVTSVMSWLLLLFNYMQINSIPKDLMPFYMHWCDPVLNDWDKTITDNNKLKKPLKQLQLREDVGAIVHFKKDNQLQVQQGTFSDTQLKAMKDTEATISLNPDVDPKGFAFLVNREVDPKGFAFLDPEEAHPRPGGLRTYVVNEATFVQFGEGEFPCQKLTSMLHRLLLLQIGLSGSQTTEKAKHSGEHAIETPEKAKETGGTSSSPLSATLPAPIIALLALLIPYGVSFLSGDNSMGLLAGIRTGFEHVPFFKFRVLATVWQAFFTCQFFQIYGEALSHFGKVRRGHRYLNQLTIFQSTQKFHLDLGGACPAKPLTAKEGAKPWTAKPLTAKQIRKNLNAWMVMRRYLRLMLIGPKSSIDGYIIVSVMFFLFLAIATLAHSFATDGPLASLAQTVAEQAAKAGSQIGSDFAKIGSDISGDISQASASLSSTMSEELSGGVSSNTTGALSNMVQGAAGSLQDTLSPYKAKALEAASNSLASIDQAALVNSAQEGVARIAAGEISSFTASCFIYLCLMTWYALKALFLIALTNDDSLERADDLIAAQEEGVARTDDLIVAQEAPAAAAPAAAAPAAAAPAAAAPAAAAPEKTTAQTVKPDLDVAIKASRAEGSAHLQTLCGKVITMAILVSAATVALYPQLDAAQRHIPVASAYACAKITNCDFFVGMETQLDTAQDFYNSTVENAIKQAENAVNTAEAQSHSFLNSSKDLAIGSIDSAHERLTYLSDRFENISLSKLNDVRTKVNMEIEVLTATAMTRVNMAREMIKDTASTAHHWAQGQVNRAAEMATGLVETTLSAAAEAVTEAHAAISKTITSVMDSVSAAVRDKLKMLQDGVNGVTNYLQSQITASQKAIKSALAAASNWAGGVLAAVDMQVTILGQTLINAADNIKNSIQAQKDALDARMTHAITYVGSEARSTVLKLQSEVDAKLDLVQQAVKSTAGKVDGALDMLHDEASDIVSEAKGKVDEISKALGEKLHTTTGMLLSAQASMTSAATQLLDKAGVAVRGMITGNLGLIEEQLDAAESLATTTMKQIQASLSSGGTPPGSAASQELAVQNLRAQIGKDQTESSARIENAIEQIKKVLPTFIKLSGAQEVDDAEKVLAKARGDAEEVLAALQSGVHQIKFVEMQLKKLLKQSTTVTASEFATSKDVVRATVSAALEKVRQSISETGAVLEVSITEVGDTSATETIRAKLDKADSELVLVQETATDTIANVKIWEDGTLSVAEQSTAELVSMAAQKLEDAVVKVRTRTADIRKAVFSELEDKTDAEMEAAQFLLEAETDKAVKQVESLKRMLEGALSSVHEGTPHSLDEVTTKMSHSASMLENETSKVMIGLKEKQQELSTMLAGQIEKAEGAGKAALEQARAAVQAQLDQVQSSIDKGHGLMKSAVASAQAAATGTLNATKNQVALFSGAINDGLTVAEHALKAKQKEISTLLDTQLDKAHDAAKSTIANAEDAVHNQIANLEGKLKDTQAKLGEGVDKLAAYASGTLEGVQKSVSRFSDMVENGLGNVKKQMLNTAGEVKDALLESISMAKQVAKGKIESVQASMNKQLDDALVVVFRQTEAIANKINSGLQSIHDKVKAGVDAGFDFVIGTLTKTLAAVRTKMKEVAAFMKSTVLKVFTTFRNALQSLRGSALALITKVHEKVSIPRVRLSDVFENYVCKPLQESIVSAAKSARTSMDVKHKQYSDMEARNWVNKPARRLALPGSKPVGALAAIQNLPETDGKQEVSLNRQMLVDALHQWWQQQSSMRSNVVDAMELSARHIQVQKALMEMQAEVHEAHLRAAELHQETILRMHMGLTFGARMRLEQLRQGFAISADDSPVSQDELEEYALLTDGTNPAAGMRIEV